MAMFGSVQLMTIAVLAGLLPLAAWAGCGSAVCSINTNWDAQGAWAEPGARFDLRYEFIDQDQPMAGDSRIGVGEISHHHDEVRTINRNWIATLDYAFSQRLGVSVSLPVVDRSHEHIHNHGGGQLPETWNFTQAGDARVLGRYHLAESGEAGIGALFGVKLPTGDFKVDNEEGELAERSLQPGTGTTDVLLGAYYRASGSGHSAWFAQVLWQSAVGEREDFRPGDRAGVDLGYRHPLNDRMAALLQLNLLYRDRDSGAQAEPEDSGGRFAFIGPGLSYTLGRDAQLYGFVQVPVYQYVNGVQLTADWSLVAGFATRF
jgi:hypothetical protein